MPAEEFPRVIGNIFADYQGMTKELARAGFHAGPDSLYTAKYIQAETQGSFAENGAHHAALVLLNPPGFTHQFQNLIFQVVRHAGIGTPELGSEAKEKQEPYHTGY
jgi:hypothetical protein